MPYLELRNITKSYGGNKVVSNLNLTIEKGEFVALLGPSGCGKTTTLRMLAGFVQPTQGEIYIQGKPVFSSEQGVNIPPEKRQIGMVFQSYAVWPHMTVWENIAYPLKFHKIPKNQVAEQVAGVIELVNLTGLEKRYPHELSGGQQQRVALARAIVAEPTLLLLDEPLSSLDAKLREKMCREISEIWHRTGITVVYVTHDQKEAFALSNTIVLMEQGEVVQYASPEQVYERPANNFVANFVGKANLLYGKATIEEISGIVLDEGSLLPVEVLEGSSKGNPALFLFRPEQVQISGRDGNGRGLEGTIAYRNYYGSYIEYGINLKGGIEIRAEANPHTRWESGEQVLITINKAITIQERVN